MSAQTFYAVLLFSVVMAFTPGPNNMMLASSGATYGVRRIRRVLRTPGTLRLFNLAMALLLAGSVIPILLEIKESL